MGDISKLKNAFQCADSVFLVTEMKDNERSVEMFAKHTYESNPELFEGDAIYAYYKMNYVLPYEKFGELKKLILTVKNSTGLRRDFMGIVAIDFFEWIGHEEDEYFDITMKFLYDHRHIWKYVFTFRDSELENIKPMLKTAAHYFKPMVVEKCLFNQKDELSVHLKTIFARQATECDDSSIDLLADIFSDNRAKNIKSYEKIDLIVRDISDNSAGETVSAAMLAQKLREGKLLLNLLLDSAIVQKILKDEREFEHEK